MPHNVAPFADGRRLWQDSVVRQYFDAEFLGTLALSQCRSGCRSGGYLTSGGCQGNAARTPTYAHPPDPRAA